MRFTALWASFALFILFPGCGNDHGHATEGSRMPLDLHNLLHTIYEQHRQTPIEKTVQYTGHGTERQIVDSATFRQDLRFLESFALNDRSFSDQYRQTTASPLTFEATSRKPYVRSLAIWPGDTSVPDSVHISYAMHQITGTRFMELTLNPSQGFRLRVREDNRIQKNLDFVIQETWD